MEALDITRLYTQGQRDCEAGRPPQSNDPNYTEGYSEKYAEEQCLTGRHEIMEAQYERNEA